MLQSAPASDLRLRPGLDRDQNLAVQLDALRRAGCYEVFENRISGKTTSRPALDRLGRGVPHLVAVME